MRKIILFLLLASGLWTCSNNEPHFDPGLFEEFQAKYATLELSRISIPDYYPFDLSGLEVGGDGTLYAVSDESGHNRVFQLTKSDSFYVSMESYVVNESEKRMDLEGLDQCDQTFYVLSEALSNVHLIDNENSAYHIDPDWNSIGLSLDQMQKDKVQGGGGAGLEGLAMDCDTGIMYLAKERGNRRIFQIKLEDGSIQEPFINLLNQKVEDSVVEKEEVNQNPEFFGDISDLEFEKGYLYVLERFRCNIMKIDVVQNKIVGNFSFTDVAYPNKIRLYQESDGKNPTYGMAEAIAMDENYIYIGFDNNGDRFHKQHILTRNWGLEREYNPLIIRFPRPADF